MPTSVLAWRSINKWLPKKSPQKIAELGSGFGHIALLLAKKYPQAEVIAYEQALIPFLVSKFFALFQSNLHIVNKDFLQEDLEEFDLLYAYLFPRAMELLAEKRIDGRLISNNFALRGQKESEKLYIGKWVKIPLYMYKEVSSKDL